MFDEMPEGEPPVSKSAPRVSGGVPEPSFADLLVAAARGDRAGAAAVPLIEAVAEAGVVSGLDDHSLIDAVVLCARLSAWSEAVSCLVLAEFDRRRSAAMSHERPDSPDVAAQEVAAALRIGPGRARARLTAGRALAERLPETWAALAGGQIDAERARVIAEGTASVEDPMVLAEIERLVLGQAMCQTAGHVRSLVLAVVLAAGADPPPPRQPSSGTRNRVCMRGRSDGDADLRVRLSSADAAEVFGTIDAVARSTLRGRGGLPLDPARAEVLRDLVVGRMSVRPVGLPAPPGDAEAVAESETVPGSAGSSTQRLVRSPRSRDVVIPTAVVSVVVPLATLLAAGSAPGEIELVGAVSPDEAVLAAMSALAGGARLRFVGVDQVGSAVAATGPSRFLPPWLADLVGVRDRTCRFPGCARIAARCDVEHLAPGPETAEVCNLLCLCRHHHRVAQVGDFVVRSIGGGVIEWRFPTGHVYRVQPRPWQPWLATVPRPVRSESESDTATFRAGTGDVIDPVSGVVVPPLTSAEIANALFALDAEYPPPDDPAWERFDAVA